VLRPVADGVLVHQSDFLQSNAVVVRGQTGALVIDPGITSSELGCLVDDLAELGEHVVAGFSTHPHWDHLLWEEGLGSVPRYGTAACAASVVEQQSEPDWQAKEAEELPPELAGEVPLDLLGRIVGLPAGTTEVPWDGPRVRILEHRAHAPGHAALLVEDRGVLVAGDMLSDILIPFLDLNGSPDPIGDYEAALRLFEDAAVNAHVVVPGHGSTGGAEELRGRIALDRAYVGALRDGGGADDPRLAPSAPNGEWLPDVHAWQAGRLGPDAGAAGD
jgi:glyoxylase-like metal-dependent hydrolase (beta-lactamase superfamily II)